MCNLRCPHCYLEDEAGTDGLVPSTRQDAIGQLVIGASFVLIFAVLIYWRGWWLLSAFLIFSNVWRMTNYFNAGLGLHIDIRDFSITPVEPKPVVRVFRK